MTERRVPRLEPLAASDLPPEVVESLAPIGGDRYNAFRTLARHPALLARYRRFGGFLVARGSLPPRERELLIMRTAWNCGTTYEWTHHSATAGEAGITDEEVRGIAVGPGWAGWSSEERALLRAADELCRHHRMSAASWGALEPRGEEALIEMCFLVGLIVQMSLFLNSVDVQVDDWCPRPAVDSPTAS